jgi:hypothetical protein
MSAPTTNVILTLDQISFLRSILHEYYFVDLHEYLCGAEKATHEEVEGILAQAEDLLYRPSFRYSPF